MIQFWKHVLQVLTQNETLALLYVLDSNGSSPGRQGFRMIVKEDGTMLGSIGGGIMEHKLVELAKSKLLNRDLAIVFKKQIHSKSVAHNQSGMICSGEQSVAIISLTENDIPLVEEIISCLQKGTTTLLQISLKGLSLDFKKSEKVYTFHYQNDTNWQYQETLGFKKKAYIIGGGHVGKALSKVLVDLEFHCTIFDNRQDLNTLENNPFAHQKKVVNYTELGSQIREGADVFIFVMTFGYRSDLEVLQQVIDKEVAFKGMMGSKEKVKQLLAEMRILGYTDEQLASIHTPIGLAIKSRTPQEIAISIAAQIIQLQNKDLA